LCGSHPYTVIKCRNSSRTHLQDSLYLRGLLQPITNDSTNGTSCPCESGLIWKGKALSICTGLSLKQSDAGISSGSHSMILLYVLSRRPGFRPPDTPRRSKNKLRLCSEGKFLSHSCSNGFDPVLTTSKVPQNTRSTFSSRCCRGAKPGIGLPSFRDRVSQVWTAFVSHQFQAGRMCTISSSGVHQG
jgi:hypothetical protein